MSGEQRALGLLERLELGLVDLALLEVVGVDAEDLVVVGVEVDVQATVRVSR